MSTFIRLLKLAWPLRWWLLLAMGMSILTIASGIGLMATSAYLISAAALHPSLAALNLAIVGVRFFGIARGAFRYLERLISHQAVFKLLSRLRVWFFTALEPLIPARLLDYTHEQRKNIHSGDLLSRILTDIDLLQNVWVRILLLPGTALVIGLGMWIFLGAFSPLLALTFTGFYALVGLGIPLLSSLLSKRLSTRHVQQKASYQVYLLESLQGMSDTVAFGHEQQRVDHLDQLNARVIKTERLLAQISGLQQGLGSLSMHLAMWTMLVVALPLLQDGSLNPIYVATLALGTLASFEAVLPIASAVQDLGQTLEAGKRLFEIVDTEPAINEPTKSAPQPEVCDLTIKNLSFRYHQSEPLVLQHLDLSIPAGSCVALVGASGSGKSTVGNLLLRYWDYGEGEILLGKQTLDGYRQEDVHKLFSVVSQQTHLFNTTIRENILLARPDASDEEFLLASKQANLDEFIASLPDGYETIVGEQGFGLSGGERQRIAIARAFLKDSPYLLLDEPTANLDALSEQAIFASLRSLLTNKTTILMTHRLADLEIASEVLVLDQGKVLERGQHYELMQLQGYYWKMWQIQHGLLV